ncbi:ankyrin repeat-containing protein [Acanthamoeba castellanii mamavirus]|nr:ankyrin repeat-containing protein [Acanthamoeba castellanii mamavirus]EJN41192.1 ankyrin containing protein [Acanthamoeba polyphaga lentillevirus]
MSLRSYMIYDEYNRKYISLYNYRTSFFSQQEKSLFDKIKSEIVSDDDFVIYGTDCKKYFLDYCILKNDLNVLDTLVLKYPWHAVIFDHSVSDFLVNSDGLVNIHQYILNFISANKIDHYEDILNYLLSHNIDISGHDNIAIMIAVQRKNLSMVKKLVEYGADIHANNDRALKLAVDDIEMFQYIVDMGANIHIDNDYCIRAATLIFNFDLLQFLVELGCDINIGNGYLLRTIINADFYYHRTITKNNVFEIVKYINVNSLGPCELTNCIHVHKNIELVKLLSDYGADFTFIDKFCVMNEYEENIVDILKHHGLKYESILKFVLKYQTFMH